MSPIERGEGGSASSDGGAPLTRMVLAVDASTTPALAADAVARVAERGTEVIVLHVHEVDRREADVVDEKVEAVATELQAAGFSVLPVMSHALPHRVAHAIAEVAREVGADMIVVGHGGPLLAALRHGSVSADLRWLAPCRVEVER